MNYWTETIILTLRFNELAIGRFTTHDSRLSTNSLIAYSYCHTNSDVSEEVSQVHFKEISHCVRNDKLAVSSEFLCSYVNRVDRFSLFTKLPSLRGFRRKLYREVVIQTFVILIPMYRKKYLNYIPRCDVVHYYAWNLRIVLLFF